jgi:adenylate cyclase class 2
MFEIELKYPVDDPTLLRQNLHRLQARPLPTQNHVDVYYRHPSRNFAETGEALRIRRVDGQPYVTYKGPKTHVNTATAQGIKVRRELEWPLFPGDPHGEQMSSLLAFLGFTQVAEVAKRREPFEIYLGNKSAAGAAEGRLVTVTVDTVECLGTYAEIESIASSDTDRPAAIEAVSQLAGQLELGPPEPKSYLRMVLEKIEKKC